MFTSSVRTNLLSGRSPRRTDTVILALCFCALLLGCSEPEDSSRIVYCKVVVIAFAFNLSDMDYIKVEELTLPSGPQVDIVFEDFNEHGIKERRRVTCDFDEIE